MMVTGSTIYTTLGCESLKRLHKHFGNVVNGRQRESLSDLQKRAMEHGTESEVHQIATLSSIILPFLFPDVEYFDGYHIENKILVSPDRNLCNRSGDEIQFASEGKAPVLEKPNTRLQHYSVPLRYISQTVFESKVTKSKNGTLYICAGYQRAPLCSECQRMKGFVKT